MKSIWQVTPQSFGTMVLKDQLMREYAKGGSLLVKRKVRSSSWLYQTSLSLNDLSPSFLHVQAIPPQLAFLNPELTLRLIGSQLTRGMWFKKLLSRILRRFSRGTAMKNMRLYDWAGLASYRRPLVLWLWDVQPIEWFLVMELLRVHYRGMRFELLGRLPHKGPKRSRARRFSVQSGYLHRSQATVSTHCLRSSIHTKLGVIGVRLYFR